MITRTRQLLRLLAMILAVSLIAAACSGSSETSSSDDGDDSGSDSSDVSGEIFISGSSTVAPISTLVAELFEDVAPDVLVDVDGPGTGDGFALFCEGTTDISDASRPIRDEEIATCEENGITFTLSLIHI